MKRALVGAFALSVGGLAVTVAWGGVTLRFSPPAAEPGQAVAVRTAGRLRSRPAVFMVSADRGPVFTLGKLRPDRNGIGRLRFLVPNARPGRYGIVVGRRRVPAGSFQVTPVVRDCSSSQYGELPADWKRRSAHAGPLTLYPVPTGFRSSSEPLKVIAIVEGSVAATLVVPPAERAHVGLLYARRGPFGRWGPGKRVADGVAAVTFAACSPSDYPQVQYGGGFVVDGPRCAQLEVRVAGRAEPIPLAVGFGRAC